MAVYTLSIWIVREGHEEEFAARWREMAGWTMEAAAGGGSSKKPGILLRDRDAPNRFISFGEWDTVAAVQAWRANPGFGEHVAGMRTLLEEFSPSTLDDVTAAPQAAPGSRLAADAVAAVTLTERVAALETALAELRARVDEAGRAGGGAAPG